MENKLIVLAASCLLAQAAAFAQVSGCDVTVINRGFEDPVLGENEYSYFIPGWIITGDSGAFNPGPQTYPDGMVVEGNNCGYVSCCAGGRDHGVMIQSLPAYLTPNTTYELSIAVGQRLETPWADMRIQLYAGTTTIIDTLIDTPPAPGTFSQRTFQFVTPPGHAGMGERLQIRISHENGIEHQADFDNLTVIARPNCVSICNQPASVQTCHGVTAEFNVAHAGVGPFTYRWFKGTEPLTDGPTPWGSVISGADSYHLHINDVHTADNGVYSLAIENDCGSVKTQDASLQVCLSDYNCDGAVDLFDYLDFVEAFSANTILADWNEDGVIDFFDYLDFVNQFATGC